jgi:short-subunit dehydrogenase
MYKYVYWFKIKNPRVGYKPVVLVTGCSSGIGLAIAKKLLAFGQYRLVLTTRSQSLELLQKMFPATENLIVMPLDVTVLNDRNSIISFVEQKWGGIDILICNAGISYRSVVEEMTDNDESIQMNTNYHGPMGLIRRCLPRMRETGRGKIINISSVSGMLAMPTMASYSASKYALEGACEALWYEVRPFGISVSLIQPGFVRSDSYERVKFSKEAKISRVSDGPYSEYYKNMEPFVAKLMKNALATPESIADLVFQVIRTENPPLWVPASVDAEFFYYLRRVFPRRLLHPFLYINLPGVKNWGKKHTRKRKKISWIEKIFRRLRV